MLQIYVGAAASVGTALLYVPQLYTTYRTKTVEGLSLNHILYSLIVCFVWLWYGIMVDDWPIIAAQISLGVQLFILCGFYSKYRHVAAASAAVSAAASAAASAVERAPLPPI